jgi:hypothetical protein
MVLNASYVCLLHSSFIKNHPIWILDDRPLISEVILSQFQIKGPLSANRISEARGDAFRLERQVNIYWPLYHYFKQSNRRRSTSANKLNTNEGDAFSTQPQIANFVRHQKYFDNCAMALGVN